MNDRRNGTPLRPAMRRPARSNRFWYRLAAVSFTIKLAIVVAAFLMLRAALP